MNIEDAFFRAIVERIEQIRLDEGYEKKAHFTEAIDYPNPNYTVLLNNPKRKASLELVISVKLRFPKYCLDWIVTGSEPKYVPDQTDPDNRSSILAENTIDPKAIEIIEKQNQKILDIYKDNSELREELLRLKGILYEKDIDY